MALLYLFCTTTAVLHTFCHNTHSCKVREAATDVLVALVRHPLSDKHPRLMKVRSVLI